MTTVSIAEAKARLSELLSRVEEGETVVITRYGREIARVEAVSKPLRPIPVEELTRFRARMPGWRKRSADLVREMREEGR